MSPRGKPGELRTKDGEWTVSQLAVLLGTTSRAIYRYLSGERYPEVRMMKRFEALFGWPAVEQVQLVPVAGYDLRYSMVLRQVMNDWTYNNPRTKTSNQLRCLYDSPRGEYSRGQLERAARERAEAFNELESEPFEEV